MRGGGTAQWVHQNKVRFFLFFCLCFNSTFFTLQMLKFVYAADHRRVIHTDLKSQWMGFTQSPLVCLQQSKDSYPLHSILAVIHAIIKEMLCPRHVSAEFDKSGLVSKYERQKLEECVLLLLLVAKEMLRIATQAGGRFCKVLAWRNNLLVKEERFERILLVT